MSAAPGPGAAPVSVPYRLVVPQGWTRMPVDPARLGPAVRAMLLRRFDRLPRDETAAVRREIEQQLVELVRGPGREYLRMLLLLDLQVERRPITATCLVSLLPQPVVGEQGLEALAESMRPGSLESVVEQLGPTRGVVVVSDVLPPGAADPLDGETARLAQRYARWLRTGAEEQVDPGDGGPVEPSSDDVPHARTSRSVDVFLPVPDSPRVLLLSFSTPVEPLFGPLTTLFLTIASTVQWQREGDAWS